MNRMDLFKFSFEVTPVFSPHHLPCLMVSTGDRGIGPKPPFSHGVPPSVIFYYVKPVSPCKSVSPVKNLGISGMDELA